MSENQQGARRANALSRNKDGCEVNAFLESRTWAFMISAAHVTLTKHLTFRNADATAFSRPSTFGKYFPFKVVIYCEHFLPRLSTGLSSNLQWRQHRHPRL